MAGCWFVTTTGGCCVAAAAVAARTGDAACLRPFVDALTPRGPDIASLVPSSKEKKSSY